MDRDGAVQGESPGPGGSLRDPVAGLQDDGDASGGWVGQYG